MALLARSNVAVRPATSGPARKILAPVRIGSVRVQASKKFDLPEVDAEELKTKATEFASNTAAFVKVCLLEGIYDGFRTVSRGARAGPPGGKRGRLARGRGADGPRPEIAGALLSRR